MDESIIWLSRLLMQAKEQHLQGERSDSEFEQVLLYTLGALLIDWSSPPWSRRIEHNDNGQTGWVQELADSCKQSLSKPNLNLDRVEELSNLLSSEVKLRDRGECFALFDTLFYRIIGRAGFNRRHAGIVAELTAGLSHESGINDLYACNGEALIRHSAWHTSKNWHLVGESETPLLHLTFLRLTVRGIKFKRTHVAKDYNKKNLTLLDHPFLLAPPFARLLDLVTTGHLTDQALIVFEVSRGRHDPLQRQIRKILADQDLLEAVIDFTSYTAEGKARRHNAWLLNSGKRHTQKTLCIDTHQTLEAIKGASSEQVAGFAAAIVQTWRSTAGPRSLFKSRLGPLQGLFAQWFDAGYRDVDGVCRVIDTSHALRAVSTKRVPARPNKPEVSLLDRRPLELLLDDSQQTAFCAYVIGNNGAGKSLLLASLISALKQRETPCAAITMGPQDRFPNADRKLGNYRYLGDRTNNGYSVRAIEGKLISLMVEMCRDPWRMEKLDHVIEQLGFKHQLYLVPKNAVDDMLQSSELSDLLKPFAQQIKESRHTRDKSLAVARQGSTKLFHFSELSSGEQQVLMLFTKIIVAAGPGKVLLIDEPEISLHVRWQQILPQLFNLIAKEMDTRLVIATHSPTLVTNAQGHADHCFLAKSQQLTPIEPERRHSVETILLEGFETYTPHNREIPERCAALVADAIRATNQSKLLDLSLEKQLLGKLDEMRAFMNASGSLRDKRFTRDQQLIGQAHRAIDETFKLAKGQTGA